MLDFLHHFIVYVAEAAEEAAPDGQQWWGLHLHPHLRSTRSLERFRNQVSPDAVADYTYLPVCLNRPGPSVGPA